MNTNFLERFLAAAALAAVAMTANAYDINSTADANVDANQVALRGFDTTSYLNVGKPTRAANEYTALFDGAIYRFVNATERDAFSANPGKFAPAYNGFCAMGAALGKKLDGDPEVYRLIEGRLYVFVSTGAALAWDKDALGNLAKADANWPRIRNKTPKELN